MTWAHWAPVPVLGLALWGVACGGRGGSTEPPGPPTQLVKSGGDGQNWFFSNPLPTPHSVQARDANNRPVPGVVVSWAVASGGGSVDPAQSTTNSSGVASTTHTLGPSEPVQTVTATPSAAGLPTLTFTANAAVPPTAAAVDLINISFSPRDVAVQVNGTVTWTWKDAPIVHNVTYTGGPTPLPASSSTVPAGTFSTTFTKVGRYEYVCTIHAGMTGTVSVVN